jgi:general secretion pathway protein I
MILDKKNQSGFSLLEVLVAFSLFAVSFSIILQIYSKGTSSARLSHEYATAVILAQSSMANIGIENFPDMGIHEESKGKYLVSINIREINDDDTFFREEQKISKRDILLNVSWEHKGKPHSIQLNSIKLYPTT